MVKTRSSTKENSASLLHPRKHSTDPRGFNWKLTGVNERSSVEYYERPGVKMDYYPSTGTVKFSLDHPKKGKTQMFRRKLTEHQFVQVLKNPRAHTGAGYQHRKGGIKANPQEKEDAVVKSILLPQLLNAKLRNRIQTKNEFDLWIAECRDTHPNSQKVLRDANRLFRLLKHHYQVLYLKTNKVQFNVSYVYGLNRKTPPKGHFYCSLCHMGGLKHDEVAHINGKIHITNAFKEFEENAECEEAALGMSNPCHDHTVLNVPIQVHQTLEFEVENRSDEMEFLKGTKVLLKRGLQQKPPKSDPVEPIAIPSNLVNVSFPPKSTKTLLIPYFMPTMGYARVKLAFQFRSGLNILRDICISGLDDDARTLLPTTPYVKKSRPRKNKNKAKEEKPEPGERPPFPKTNGILRVKFFDIPTDIRRHFELCQDPDRRGKPMELRPPEDLNESNHKENFSNMLFIEELQLEDDMALYDLDQVELTTRGQGRYLWLKVPGLAEKRPSVLYGDKVMVTLSSKVYEGFVHAVELEQVGLRLSAKFHANYIKGMKVFVRFTVSRSCIRKYHQALELTQEKDFPRGPLLFPAPDLKAWHTSSTREQRSDLNEKQHQVVQFIAQDVWNTPLMILFGPPGTGKTSTLVASVLDVFFSKSASSSNSTLRCLLCAPSNDAADLLVERLVRLGHLTPKEIFRLNAYQRQKSGVPSVVLKHSNYDESIRCFQLPLLQQLLSYRVIVTTMGSAMNLWTNGVRRGDFSHIFIDEAGHATEPEVLCCISPFTTSKTKVVLAGDPKQLGPIVRSTWASRSGLGMSLMERLVQLANSDYSVPKPWDFEIPSRVPIMMLTNNYRSHWSILKTPSNCFYSDALKVCGPAEQINRFIGWKELPNPKIPIVFHGVVGQEMREGNSPSWFSPHEASYVSYYIAKVAQHRSSGSRLADIGVISPYRRQVQKIQKLLKKKGNSETKVGSCEQFQGQERQVIIISTVRSQSQYLEADLKFNLGFVGNPKRFNVALTRAQALLIVIGNPNVLCQDPNWNAFLRFCQEHNCCVGESLPPEGEPNEEAVDLDLAQAMEQMGIQDMYAFFDEPSDEDFLEEGAA